MTTSTVFKVVLLVCIAVLVGLIIKVEMAAGHDAPDRRLSVATTFDANRVQRWCRAADRIIRSESVSKNGGRRAAIALHGYLK